jgi:hypothetical protein
MIFFVYLQLCPMLSMVLVWWIQQEIDLLKVSLYFFKYLQLNFVPSIVSKLGIGP